MTNDWHDVSLPEGWLPVTHAGCGGLAGLIVASPIDPNLWPMGAVNHRHADGSPFKENEFIRCSACGAEFKASISVSTLPWYVDATGKWWQR